MEYHFRSSLELATSPRRTSVFRGGGGSDVISLAMLLLLLSVLLGVGQSSSSADDSRMRCEAMTFVSLDAVGMSERPCWSVCPPLKSLPMHTRFCQRNCPEYFQECVSIPNVGQSVGSGSGQEAAGMEGHVTMAVFIIVSVALAVLMVVVAIVTAMVMRCCLNNVISQHCKCKHRQPLKQPTEPTSKENHVKDEAATLMIRAPNPPDYVHQIDDDVTYKPWSSSEKRRPEAEVDDSTLKKPASDSAASSHRNVTTAAEVHSSDRNSNLIP